MKRRSVLLGGALVIVLLVAIIAVVTIYHHNADRDQRQPDTSRDQQQDKNHPSGVSKAEAEKKALDEFGGTVKETESDSYKGVPAWEVEIRDSKHGRIEVKVDKATGEILHYEKD